MDLSEMFGDDDPRTFEDSREVVAIVRSAADFAGTDGELQPSSWP